jgi:hypothetical protein
MTRAMMNGMIDWAVAQITVPTMYATKAHVITMRLP